MQVNYARRIDNTKIRAKIERMTKKSDKKSILKRAKEKSVKTKVTFSLDDDVFKKFKEACEKEDAAMSRVVEELMKDFAEG